MPGDFRFTHQLLDWNAMDTVHRVYIGRLRGMTVRGPDSEPIGRVRDVIVTVRPVGRTTRALGIVVELVNKRRIFIPMLRIATIEPGDVTLATGSVSMRTYQPRGGELALFHEVIGTKVHINDPEHPEFFDTPLEVADVELEQTRTRDWIISSLALFARRPKFGRSPTLITVNWRYIQGVGSGTSPLTESVQDILTEFEDMRPADVAQILSDLPQSQKNQVANELNDVRLADIIQELPSDDQSEFLENMGIERAAAILEEMEPDDAADLLGDLPNSKAEVLLKLMDPEESAPVRRLMSFSPDTVGSLMTPEPLVLTPQATVAEALAMARNPDLTTSIASLLFVVRPPTATPTGHFLGSVHIQKLLREPPSSLIVGILDPDLPPLYADDDQETAARFFATYNLVCGPVLDHDNHLLGAVTVDDLLDHMLPDDWRETGLRPKEVNNG